MLTHVTQCTSAKRTVKAIDETLQYLQINGIIVIRNGINQLSHRNTLQLHQIVFFETRILQKAVTV
jgi:hypothetical protein